MIISILLRAVLDPGHPVSNSAYQACKLNSLLHNSVLMIDLQPAVASADKLIYSIIGFL
jgi:hypothetical protein